MDISGRDHIIIIISMTKDLVEKVGNRHEKMENFSKEVETI